MSADRRIERVTAMLFAVLALGSTGPAEAANGAPPEPTTGGFDTEARRRTMREMRAVGLAAAHWIADQGGIYHRGEDAAGRDWYTTAAELEAVLVPRYLAKIPTEDGWGHPYEYLVLAHAPIESGSTSSHIVIRSPGRDGEYSHEHAYDYLRGVFEATAFDEDLVWVDWRFVRSPQHEPLDAGRHSARPSSQQLTPRD